MLETSLSDIQRRTFSITLVLLVLQAITHIYLIEIKIDRTRLRIYGLE